MIIVMDLVDMESFKFKENVTGKKGAIKKHDELIRKNGGKNVRVVYGMPEVSR